MRVLRHARESLKSTIPVKAQRHRVLGAQLKIHGQHHATIIQRQRRVAHQMAGVPQPRQGQHAHGLKRQFGKAAACAALAQMQHARRRPPAPTRGHDKQVHATAAVRPRNRVAQAAHAKTQGLAHGKTIHHQACGSPLPGRAIKLGCGDLHIGCALAVAREPECSKRGRMVGGHGQQRAGMGSGHTVGHGNRTPVFFNQIGGVLHNRLGRYNRSGNQRRGSALHHVQCHHGAGSQHYTQQTPGDGTRSG